VDENMEKIPITLEINGEKHDLLVKPHWTLLHVLREELGLTGTKDGCSGKGECGFCTIIIDGVAKLSCLIPAVHVQGKKIITIEGLTEGGKLHPVQEAFIDEGAVNCGMCMPGMVMAAKAFLDENPNPTEKEVRVALSGNFCRCGGYIRPIKAVLTAAKRMRGGK
jgi:carbon-monoxide dehydrogenase small subunit